MVTDISSEVAKLQASYDTIIQSRDEAKKQLAKEISEQQMTKWEIAHQSTRTEYYEKMDDQIHIDISALRSHIPMLSRSCFRSVDFFLITFCVLWRFKNRMIATQTTTRCVSVFSGHRGGLQTLPTRMDLHELGVLLLRFL